MHAPDSELPCACGHRWQSHFRVINRPHADCAECDCSGYKPGDWSARCVCGHPEKEHAPDGVFRDACGLDCDCRRFNRPPQCPYCATAMEFLSRHDAPRPSALCPRCGAELHGERDLPPTYTCVP